MTSFFRSLSSWRVCFLCRHNISTKPEESTLGTMDTVEGDVILSLLAEQLNNRQSTTPPRKNFLKIRGNRTHYKLRK